MSDAEDAVALKSDLQMYDEAMDLHAERGEDEEVDEYEDWEDTMLAVVHEFAERTRLTIHPALWGIEAMQSEDELKRDLELTCTSCREILCDVEPSDIFAVLMSTAFDHIRERHSAPAGEEQHP